MVVLAMPQELKGLFADSEQATAHLRNVKERAVLAWHVS